MVSPRNKGKNFREIQFSNSLLEFFRHILCCVKQIRTSEHLKRDTQGTASGSPVCPLKNICFLPFRFVSALSVQVDSSILKDYCAKSMAVVTTPFFVSTPTNIPESFLSLRSFANSSFETVSVLSSPPFWYIVLSSTLKMCFRSEEI